MVLRKRIVSACLAFALLLSLIPITAFAADVSYRQVEVSSLDDFQTAYTSEENTEIIFTSSLQQWCNAVVPAGYTKYIHSSADSDTVYTYSEYLYGKLSVTDSNSAVILEKVDMGGTTMAVTGGTLTMRNATTYKITLDGDDAVLNMEDGAATATSGTLTYTNGTVNLSGEVTVKRLYFNGTADPMVITSSIAGSNIQIYSWTNFTGSYDVVLAKGSDDYTLTEDDLAAFSVRSKIQVDDYELVLDEENNQILYKNTAEAAEVDYTVTLAGLDAYYSITADASNCNTDMYNDQGSYINIVYREGYESIIEYFDGALVEPAVTVTDSNGNTLTEAEKDESGDYVLDDNGNYVSGDFIVTYTTATDHSLSGSSETATATVTGIGDYADVINETVDYTVKRTAASSAFTVDAVTLTAAEVGTISAGSSLGDEGSGKAALEAALKVYDGETELELGVHYNVTVGTSSISSADTYTVTISGIGPYYGSTSTTLTLEQVDLSTNEQITLETIPTQYYTGEAVTPTPVLFYTRADDTVVYLDEGTDYTVEYENNTDVTTTRSKAWVIITGIGNYAGELEASFEIVDMTAEDAAEQLLPVSDEAELSAALYYGLTDITIDADFSLTSPVELTYDVTISGCEGESYTITSAMTSGTMFTAAEGVSVTLDDVTLNGSGTSALLYVCADAKVDIGTSATLINGYYNGSSDGAAALYIESGAEVTLAGAVQDCTGGSSNYPIYNAGTLTIVEGAYLTRLSSSRSAIYNKGTMNMTGGTFDADLQGYYSASQLNGTLINNQGTFNLSGGAINGFLLARDDDGNLILDEEGNYTYSSERTTVMYSAILSRGTFNMSGGAITGFEGTGSVGSFNYDDYQSGGGVYNLGEFTMSGGTITDNIAVGSVVEEYTSDSTSSGAGGGVYNQGVFYMTGGTISNNSAHMGGGVYNAPSIDFSDSKGATRQEDAGQFYMSGGTITGNELINTEVSSSASTGNGLGDSGSVATVNSGSAIYASGDSVTEISGEAVIDGDATIAYTDSDGNESTYQAGIAVGVGTVSENESGGNSYSSAGGTLTITGEPTINVGILLINASSISYSTDLDNYAELKTQVDAGEADAYDYSLYQYDLESDSTTVSSEASYISYLVLDGNLKTALEVNTVTASRTAVKFNLGNSTAGLSIATSLAFYDYDWNLDGDIVAIYAEDTVASENDSTLLTLIANGKTVDEAEAAIYLTEESNWVICTHSTELEYVEATVATCTEDGVLAHYVCPTCGILFDEDGTTVVAEEDLVGESATGHDYQFTYTWSADRSACTVTISCSQGDYEAVTEDCTVTQAMDENGATVYTASWTFQGATYSDIVTHTHTYVGTAETTPATCTEDGYITVTVACTDGDSQLYTYTIPVSATGHSWDEGVETVAATRYTQGEMVYTCTECGETKTEYTNKVNATFLFDDVMNDSQYYFIPVYWAYDLGITSGTSATLFSPSQGCTRAQFVTFLYRLAQANGVDTSIGDTSCNFTDVSSSAYYYKAVLWAYDLGITSGTSDTTFTPNRTITRREAITMLYRYECAVNETPTVETENPFSDVTTSDYAYTAILWANETNVTSGTSETTFSPANTCTRAMMVTFLYNYAAIQD